MAHVQWEAILDDELVNAIVVGLKIQCLDGVWRRFFIRIFTYSTDYPERYATPLMLNVNCPI
jgi:hypothetical protein